jgi:hypothetical protein
MKKIRCTLGTIRNAIAELEEYEKDLQKKVHTLMEKLAEIGVENARQGFGKAIYAGTNDVVVEPLTWVDDNKLIVVARGNAITFIEFGAGVHYAADAHPLAGDFGFNRGGYGHGLGRLDSWRYKGDPGNAGTVIEDGKHQGEVSTHGNPANRAMYEAAKEMREQITKLAEEVFGHD